MKVHVGSRIAVAPRTVNGAVRDGEVIEVRGADGGPPYVVRWSDDGHEGLYFPGVDARVLVDEDADETPAAGHADAPQTAAPEPRHVRSWRVDIDLFEEGDQTRAHAVLRSEAPDSLAGRGEAHRRRGDADVPEIGDEIAAARALSRLAERLLEAASADLTALEGSPVQISAT